MDLYANDRLVVALCSLPGDVMFVSGGYHMDLNIHFLY